MTRTAARYTIEPVEQVGESAAVRDYDELAEDAKVAVSRLAGDTEAVPADGAADLGALDVVRFGDYYRVERVPHAASD